MQELHREIFQIRVEMIRSIEWSWWWSAQIPYVWIILSLIQCILCKNLIENLVSDLHPCKTVASIRAPPALAEGRGYTFHVFNISAHLNKTRSLVYLFLSSPSTFSSALFLGPVQKLFWWNIYEPPPIKTSGFAGCTLWRDTTRVLDGEFTPPLPGLLADSPSTCYTSS